MQVTGIRRVIPAVILVVGLALAACADDPASPLPTGIGGMDHTMPAGAAVPTSAVVDLTTFTHRAPLDPYRIHQLPGFLMHSTERTDIVFQRSVFNPGTGPWHTHPGPSFIYVVSGSIKLQRYNKQMGCHETPVHMTGDSYFEVADEVHRAVVTSSTPAVLVVTRFNIPVGSPITMPAADPGC